MRQHTFTKGEVVQGRSMADSLHIDSTSMSQFYEYAQELFNEQKYQDAVDVLFLLTVLKPFEPTYWLALGTAEKGQKNYDASLDALNMCLSLNPEEPAGYIEAISTCLEMEEKEAALDYIEFMLALVSHQFKDAREQAEALRKELQKA